MHIITSDAHTYTSQAYHLKFVLILDPFLELHMGQPRGVEERDNSCKAWGICWVGCGGEGGELGG